MFPPDIGCILLSRYLAGIDQFHNFDIVLLHRRIFLDHKVRIDLVKWLLPLKILFHMDNTCKLHFQRNCRFPENNSHNQIL
jgi:hypothetical protein